MPFKNLEKYFDIFQNISKLIKTVQMKPQGKKFLVNISNLVSHNYISHINSHTFKWYYLCVNNVPTYVSVSDTNDSLLHTSLKV